MDDYDRDDQSLYVKHRGETGTPIKNEGNGERFVALTDETCAVLDAWLDDRRGAIAYWLGSDIPETVASDRSNASPEILREHYDQRSEHAKME